MLLMLTLSRMQAFALPRSRAARLHLAAVHALSFMVALTLSLVATLELEPLPS